ncbi:hypothetical protein ABZ565_04275 [Streptomyces sp. NPDC016469]|uniref:hypothetical protein n=1 Tax=Streptomyces sp. NPDC016469 TaxID=3157191 RepID=UPI0033E99E96
MTDVIGADDDGLLGICPSDQELNRALAQARTPLEGGVARLKSCRIFRQSGCSPEVLSKTVN